MGDLESICRHKFGSQGGTENEPRTKPRARHGGGNSAAAPLDPRGALGARKARGRAAIPNLNLVLYFSVPHFCTTLFSTSLLHYTFQYLTCLHFTSCTHFPAFTFPHLTSCTYFSAHPALTYIGFSALPFPHLLAFFKRFSLGANFLRDFPLEGGSFLEWGPTRS